MDQSEVPDLATLLTQSEDSVETLALAKTFASDDDEVNLNELVDLISTTIGGGSSDSTITGGKNEPRSRMCV